MASRLRLPTVPVRQASLALLVMAYGVSVCILLAVLAAVTGNDGAAAPSSGSPAREVTRAPDFFGSPLIPPGDVAVVLTVEIVELDPGRQVARFQVGARVQLDRLDPALLEAYRGGNFTDGDRGLPVRISGYGETFQYRIQQQSEENERDSAKVTYEAYSSGSTSRYPFDRYNTVFGVVPPEGLAVSLLVSRSPAWSDPFSLQARNITETFAEDTRSDEFVAVAFDAKRSWSTGVFALLVALSPMFLLVISWEQLRSRSADNSPGHVAGQHVTQALPLELAAAFLALLTLRQVLVPDEITGPTVIDGLLALELSLFVALLVHVWAIRIRRGP